MNEFQVKAIQFTGDHDNYRHILDMLGLRLEYHNSPTDYKVKLDGVKKAMFSSGDTLRIDHLRFDMGDYVVLFPDGCIAKVKADAFVGRYAKKYPKVTSPSPESTIYIRKDEIT